MTAQAEHHVGTTRDAAGAEMLRWFFDDLLPRWDAAVVGTEDPRTVAGLCATPMLVATCDGVVRARDHAEVAELLAMHITSLRTAGNDHVLAPDCRVTAYSPVAGALDVIWSHRAADGTEVLRLAVRYEIAWVDATWQVTTAHIVPTDQTTLDRIWTPTPAHEIG